MWHPLHMPTETVGAFIQLRNVAKVCKEPQVQTSLSPLLLLSPVPDWWPKGLQPLPGKVLYLPEEKASSSFYVRCFKHIKAARTR